MVVDKSILMIFSAITIIVVGIISISIISSGNIIVQIPDKGSLVTCSDYYQVTDKYITPGPVYKMTFHPSISIFGDEANTRKMGKEEYDKISIGQYFTFTNTLSIPYYINLTKVSDNESGYRDACRVV